MENELFKVCSLQQALQQMDIIRGARSESDRKAKRTLFGSREDYNPLFNWPFSVSNLNLILIAELN